ncbi:unnamed protein product [Allacma fusca]|uniref:Uncharacterized protein n=1 Tax=Allacma fusca TaxID=39272 RepID=A0A8J2JCS3_9HEXA|nr:unnamed protein product [Allacma fusca]
MASTARGCPYSYSLFEKWCQQQMHTVSNSKKVPSTWPGPTGETPALVSHQPCFYEPALEQPFGISSNTLKRQNTMYFPFYAGKGDSECQPENYELFIVKSDSGEADDSPMIKNVWRRNLAEEFTVIRKLLPKYRYVAMDTEFPGVVFQNSHARSMGLEGNQLDTIRQNVDVLKLIQLGISFFDENGSSPPGTSTWQFNFKFNLRIDRWAENSIGLLQDAGMQFERHEKEGIDPEDFCYLFLSSGLVLQEEVVWLTYHGGYDFGYLMRILRGQNLPTKSQFSEFMKTYFPTCYDLKVLLAGHPTFVGGLHDISVRLGLSRVGVPHQAGSDSLLTGKTFFKIKEKFFDNPSSEDFTLDKFNGKIFGLGYKFEECVSASAVLKTDESVLPRTRCNAEDGCGDDRYLPLPLGEASILNDYESVGQTPGDSIFLSSIINNF